jgi:hypothetical protein
MSTYDEWSKDSANYFEEDGDYDFLQRSILSHTEETPCEDTSRQYAAFSAS